MPKTLDPIRHSECPIPVFKQGDDLAFHLGEVAKADPARPSHLVAAEAFRRLADQYGAAADLCRRMASVAAEVPGLEADADCHHIGVSGPREALDRLTEGPERGPRGDAPLHVPEWEDEEEEEEDGEGDDGDQSSLG